MARIFFASDFHLDPGHRNNFEREERVCAWLDMVKESADELFLVGDLFDFWHDYRHVVPKGSVRFLSKVQEIVRSGIPVTIFSGNHDIWLYGYFEDELGVSITRKPIQIERDGKKFYIAHGDGLGPGDHGYKFIKKVFTNRLCQWIFRWIHPDIGVPMARFFSRKSRDAEDGSEGGFLGEDKEWLIQHSKDELGKAHHDFFIYGHRHLPIYFPIDHSLYVNLGDWINHFTFGEFDGHHLELKIFNQDGSVSPFTTRYQ